jgi:hypothetical protein
MASWGVSSTNTAFSQFTPWGTETTRFEFRLPQIRRVYGTMSINRIVNGVSTLISTVSIKADTVAGLTFYYYLQGAGTYTISFNAGSSLAYVQICNNYDGGYQLTGILTRYDYTLIVDKTFGKTITVEISETGTFNQGCRVDNANTDFDYQFGMERLNLNKYSGSNNWYAASNYLGRTFYKLDVYVDQTTGYPGSVLMQYPYTINATSVGFETLYIPSDFSYIQFYALGTNGTGFFYWRLDSPTGTIYSYANPLVIPYNDAILGGHNQLLAVFCKSGFCRSGYTLSPDGQYCFRILTQTPTLVDTNQTGTGANNDAYGSQGFFIYKQEGYQSDGFPNGDPNLAESYDVFGITTYPNTAVLNFWEGRMNAAGIWKAGNTSYSLTPLYLCAVINVATNGYYYIGTGGDNGITIKINGPVVGSRTIITQPFSLVRDFRYWHIYPIYLYSGQNIITLANTNEPGTVGSFAAEIYQNTLAELTAATSTAALTRIFTTETYRTGGPNQLTNYCSNWSCADSTYTYNPVSGMCEKTETVSVSCVG